MAKKRQGGREAVLGFIDRVMERTVPEHEKLCDAGRCGPLDPCPWCRIHEIMMESLG